MPPTMASKRKKLIKAKYPLPRTEGFQLARNSVSGQFAPRPAVNGKVPQYKVVKNSRGPPARK